MKFVSVVATISVAAAANAVGDSSFPKTWEEFHSIDGNSFPHLFSRYKKAFNKVYSADEETVKYDVFRTKVKSFFDWNAGKHSYRKGITKFTDMSDDDRKSYVMPEVKAEASRAPSKSSSSRTPRTRTLNGFESTEICDLRSYATSIKDQASCGSCWAFGTIAAAEASHALWAMTDANGNKMDVSNDAWQLSEQVLVDCCDSCNGCGGGGTFEPMACAVRLGALPSKLSHPYTATDNATCAHSDFESSGHVDAWYEPCSSGDEACLKGYLGGDSCTTFATTALKTSIEVIDSFYDYVDGVYSDPSCPDDIHNHAVAIVGWGTDESGTDYWIMRNSWGTEWGQSGYFYMERGVNMCCVACSNLFFQ